MRNMSAWVSDFRLACRTLAKAKAFTLVAVLTLAFGIGLNTAIFSGVYSYLWSPFPYPHDEELFSLTQTNRAQAMEVGLSFLDGEDWRAARSLESLALYRGQTLALNAMGAPVNVFAVMTTPNLFQVLGVGPVMGRGFSAVEAEPGEHRVAIISDGLWRRQLSADPNAVGLDMRLDGRNYTIIGILPPEFTFLYDDADVFLPLNLAPDVLRNRGNRSFASIGRLRPVSSIAQLRTEIETISARMQRDEPGTNLGWTGKVWTLAEYVIPRNARLASFTALLAVGFVLLIACANIADLLLARGTLRHKELAIRTSLGASRGSLVRLLLAESVVLGVAGGLLALLLAHWGMPLLKRIPPPDTPRMGLIQLNLPALLYTSALSLATGLLAGVAPALALSHSEPIAALQGTARGSTAGRRRLLNALVVGQVAVAVILLAVSGLLIRALAIQVNASPGFDKKNLLTARVLLPPTRYSDPAQVRAFFERVEHTLGINARVTAAAAVDSLPLGGSSYSVPAVVEGRPSTDAREQNMVGRIIVTPGYFRTLGIPLLAGREFDSRDGPETAAVALVNETMARRYWNDPGNAVGRRFRVENSADWITVAGVVADVRHRLVARPARPEIFLPHSQRPSRFMTLIARTRIDPAQLAGDMRDAIWEADRDQPVRQLESMEDMLDRRMASTRALTQILGMLAGLALLLASIGMYGVMAYTTNQRTREIGVRMALGARRGDIVRMVLARGIWMMVAGLAIGLPCAFALTPLVQSLLLGVQPHDVMTFVAVSAVLIAVAMIACGLPAQRASRVDPVTTLRVE